MLLQQPVDVLDLGAGARRDALLARSFENIGIAPLPRRHREDDRALALDDCFVEIGRGDLILHLGDAGQHAHDAAEAADLLDLRQLIGEVLEIELALAHLLGDLLRLLRIDRLRGLLDQRDDVAHAENAVGDAVGMEILERIHLLAGAEQLDRLAGDGAHRERRAAAPVAIDAGQHDAGDADAIVEILGEIDGVLAGEAVGDEQDLMRRSAAPLDLHHLGHQGLVDMGAAGGVEHHDVIALQPRRLFGAPGDLHRRLAGDDRQRIDADLAAEHRELLLRGRALHVERGHQHAALHPLGEALGDLRRGRRLAGALQADHHDRDRRRRIEIDRLRVGAQRLDQDVIDDLDDHLAGRHRFDDIGADGAGAHLVDEGAHDIERDIGFEQSAAHLAQREVHVLFGERAAPRQPVQYA